MTVGSEGQVLNPAQVNLSPGPGPNSPPTQGRQGEYDIALIHGKNYTGALNKNLFSFNVTAVTIPAIAATLVSVFTLWNPPGSGVIGEMVDTEVGQVLATTVVDTVGWYYSAGAAALAGTFTTPSVALTNHFAARIGDTPANQIKPYTAYTHSGTPARVDIIGAFGATTDAGFALPSKSYDGKLALPPGVAISVAMSTAVGTTSGLDLSCRWLEWPFA